MIESLDYDNVLILPKRSTIKSRKDVVLEREFQFYWSPRKIKVIPVVCSNMSFVNKRVAQIFTQNNMICVLPKFLDSETMYDIISSCSNEVSLAPHIDNVWVSIGMSDQDINKIKMLETRLHISPNLICDVANGYTQSFVEFCAKVRKNFPESIICAGNVVTSDMAHELILSGKVDCIKNGIGGSAVCATRVKTGIGFGQVSSNLSCSEVHGLKSGDKKLGLIMSDGGCQSPGDICKSFASRSDFTMCASIFAGVEESEGEWEYDSIIEYFYCDEQRQKLGYPFNSENAIIGVRNDDGSQITTRCTLDPNKKDKIFGNKTNYIFYGMSSLMAQDKHFSRKDYHKSEGRVVRIPNKGPLQDILDDIKSGLRSCCAYLGATEIRHISKCATFVKVNQTHNRMYEGYQIGE